ncbi:hypothetical protein F383_01371 [Gossypium arboreum]|uniref:Uncharacterized protein n=1 Tax=Gossypium arboreum TaxID=29729 RepID=A0A0B0PZP0_GOSAR|nr:hypothetical protein F383_27311 [Gossypium arboreum]KHG30332.1 hypothetical protein F383_01371 [Gossypium arboreum]
MICNPIFVMDTCEGCYIYWY